MTGSAWYVMWRSFILWLDDDIVILMSLWSFEWQHTRPSVYSDINGGALMLFYPLQAAQITSSSCQSDSSHSVHLVSTAPTSTVFMKALLALRWTLHSSHWPGCADAVKHPDVFECGLKKCKWKRGHNGYNFFIAFQMQPIGFVAGQQPSTQCLASFFVH